MLVGWEKWILDWALTLILKIVCVLFMQCLKMVEGKSLMVGL